ncbi:hypothetical protein GCM10010303_44390 [Streptomyces purpurascens]|nr:hypothetical protein GCM10010303_44390 [Streptomyces purpurascens]
MPPSGHQHVVQEQGEYGLRGGRERVLSRAADLTWIVWDELWDRLEPLFP